MWKGVLGVLVGHVPRGEWPTVGTIPGPRVEYGFGIENYRNVSGRRRM